MGKPAVSVLSIAVCAVLAIPVTAAAAETESCNPSPKVAASFCVTSDLTASSVVASAPFGVDLLAGDSSTDFSSDTSEWVNRATIGLAAVGTSGPQITPSASMPDGLRIAGGPPCTSPAYTDCSAGHGVIAGNVTGTFGVFDGYHEGTFGIASIVNVADAGAGNLAHYVINIDYCIPGLSFTCLIESSVALDAVIADSPGADELSFPTRATIVKAIPVCGCDATGDVTVKSVSLHTDSQSSVLANGNPAGGTFAPVRLPARCGNATVSASFLGGDDARTVTSSRSFGVRGCHTTTTIAIVKTRHRIRASGAVRPGHTHPSVTVLLLRRRHRHFVQLGKKTASLTGSGAFATSFHRPARGRCRAVVSYSGDATYLGSTARRSFSC